jgi:hypothetical protein
VGVLGVSLEMECENIEAGTKLDDKMYNPKWYLTSEGSLAHDIVDHKGSRISGQIGGVGLSK